VLGWVLPLAVQVVHAIAVAPTYHVGSFDDDANYLMAAHVLASGGWLTTTMPSGAAVVANYLPGYPALLVPLVWLFGTAVWPPRVLSSVCIAALYPLLWVWMGRRGVGRWHRTATLGLLAINTVLATYSTMVMAEAPFLVVLVLALFALDRWELRAGWPNATLVVVALAGLIWLKEAGAGLVVGLVAYELWRRRWRRATVVSLGVGALLLPGLVARWSTGNAALGDRYVGEIANSGQGGLLHQVLSEAPQDAWSYLRSVLRQSVLPTGGPLPSHGPLNVLVAVVGVSVPVFVAVGAVSWYRRHPRAESWMLWAYFAETLGYPYTNQRRVVLVLPLVTMWYVEGACVAGRWASALGSRLLSRAAVSLALLMAVLLAGAPTAAGFTRNYLYAWGQKSSEFAGSPAMTLLKAIGPPSAVVETDYRGSVAYFSGHRTAWTAFTTTTTYGPLASPNKSGCTLPVVEAALRADDASFLMVGDVNQPGLMDSPCLLRLASSAPTARALGAVRLLSSDHDQTSVFELLGLARRPGLADWTKDAPAASPTSPASPGPPAVEGAASSRLAPAAPGTSRPAGVATAVRLVRNGQGDAGGTGYVGVASAGLAQFTWSWPEPVPVSQVSVGLVTSPTPVSSVSVLLETPAGSWRVVARATGPIGDSGAAPYLLATLPAGTRLSALRVAAATSSRAEIAYVDAIGPP
jgi:hypothetical protein